MAEEKSLKQKAFDVGKGRLTSTRLTRTADTLSRAANRLAGYAYNAAVTADNIMTAFADKQTEEEKNSQNKKFDPEQNAANSIIESRGAEYVEDNFKTWSESTYDDGKIKQWSDDWIADMSDAETLASKTGVTVEQAQNWLNDKGDAWLKNYDVDLTNLLNKVKTASGMANIEATQNNIMGQPGNINDNLANYQKKYNEGGFGAIDIGGKYDPSTPQGRMNAGLAYVNSNITADADYAIKTGVTENEFVESYLSSADSFMEGYIPEDDDISKNLYGNIRSQIESEARTAYRTSLSNEMSNAQSLNSRYQQIEYEYSKTTGFEKPTYDDVFNMINESGLDYDNPLHRQYINTILANNGMSEEIMADEGLRNAIDSIQESDFYTDTYQGIGIYSNGTRVELPDDLSDFSIEMDAFLSGNYIRTGMQPLIDEIAQEYGIEEGSDRYSLLVQTVSEMESSRNATKMEYNISRIRNAYNSDMSDNDFLQLLSEVYYSGGITTDERNSWLSKMDSRESIYRPYREEGRKMIAEIISGLDIDDAILKSRLTNILLNSGDSDDNIDREILSISGSPETLRSLTPSEWEAYVNRTLVTLSDEMFSNSIDRFISNGISAITGKDYISYRTSILRNNDIMTIYSDAMKGMYPDLVNSNAISNVRLMLDNSVAGSDSVDIKADDLYKQVTETIFGAGTKFGDLDDYQKNQVILNSAVALVDSTMVSDLYKYLTGGDDSIKLNAREVVIDGIGHGLMDSNGNVFVIDPESYGTYHSTVLSFYYPTSSEEFKSVWGDSKTKKTLNTLNKQTYIYKIGYAPSSYTIGGKDYSDDPLVSGKSSLKISEPLYTNEIFNAGLRGLRGGF